MTPHESNWRTGEFCGKIRQIRDFYAKEIEDHEVEKTLETVKHQLTVDPNNGRLLKERDEYESYLKSMDALETSTRVICDDRGVVNCDDLRLARETLGKEIRKYAFFILIGGKRKYFRNMERDFDDVLARECSENRG